MPPEMELCAMASILHSPTQSEQIRVNLGVFRAEFGRNFGLVGMCEGG